MKRCACCMRVTRENLSACKAFVDFWDDHVIIPSVRVFYRHPMHMEDLFSSRTGQRYKLHRILLFPLGPANKCVMHDCAFTGALIVFIIQISYTVRILIV